MGQSASSLTQSEIEELYDHCQGRFSQDDIQKLYTRFRELDRSGSGFLTADELLSIPELSLNPLASRIILVVQDVNFRQFLTVLSAFSNRATREEKIDFLFKMHDLDGDGLVSEADLNAVLKLLVGDYLTGEQVAFLIKRSLRAAGMDPDQGVTLQDFEKVFANRGVGLLVEVPSDF